MTSTAQVVDAAQVQRLSDDMVTFLETNVPPDGLFHPDVFCDLSLPQWRLQTDGVDALVRLRLEGHPNTGQVRRRRADATPDGFIFEFEERWTDANGENWYAREMLRATVSDGRITEASIYCTGDWNQARQTEHAQAVRLLRP